MKNEPKPINLTCRICGVRNWHNHPETGLFTALTEATGHQVCGECIRLGKEIPARGEQFTLFPEPVSGVEDLPFD